MTTMLIFASTFALVFALVFQSLNVNNGHYRSAFFTSFGISIANIVLYKTVPQANALEILAYMCAGPLAIVSSMKAHDWWHK